MKVLRRDGTQVRTLVDALAVLDAARLAYAKMVQSSEARRVAARASIKLADKEEAQMLAALSAAQVEFDRAMLDQRIDAPPGSPWHQEGSAA